LAKAILLSLKLPSVKTGGNEMDECKKSLPSLLSDGQ